MYLIVVPAVLCLTAVPVIPSRHEIHKRMTPEQVLQVFGTTHETVPDYDIVSVRVSNVQKLSKSAGTPVQIRAPNNDIDLLLLLTDGILATENTPVTIATGSGHRDEVLYRDDPTIMQRVGIPYRDVDTNSVIFLSQHRNRRHTLNGYIRSKNMVIRSLPEEYDNANNSNSHIVFVSNRTSFEPDNQNYHLNETMLQSRFSRNKREVPSIIYPEVLAVVDTTSYVWLGSDFVNTVRYVLELWNSIQVRYSSIRNPKVRINIARIIIATEPEGTPYIVTSGLDGTMMAMYSTLDEAGDHFRSREQNIPSASYDVIMIMTKMNLISEDGIEARGVAFVGGACTWHPVGIFRDDGDYSVRTPSHELAHLLGAEHDKDSCEGGYIMSTEVNIYADNLNYWSFSNCSVRSIRDKIQHDLMCLTNKPMTKGKVLPRILPRLTVDEQCQARGAFRSCGFPYIVSRNGVCSTQFACLYPSTQNNVPRCLKHGLYPADGTSCGEEGEICLRGKCVSL